MYPLLETIALRDGVFENLQYHQERIDRSCVSSLPSSSSFLEARERQNSDYHRVDIKKVCSTINASHEGLFKVRILYGAGAVTIESVTPYTLKKTFSLTIVEDDTIEYSCKYANRESLNKLFSLRGVADNIVIVQNGLVTDTAYTNIVMFDGTQWYTPKKPLLAGTMRAKLLAEGSIVEADISVAMLKEAREIRLINAFMRLEDKVVATLL